MNQYYTHQKFLRELLESFDYSKNIKCLEFGSGDGSSSLFSEYTKKNKNLTVECYEHDTEWLKQMESKYGSENYSFFSVDWNNINYEELQKGEYDLIFVDQGDWDARIKTIDSLVNNSKNIILHDYCYYNGFRGYEISEDQKEKSLTLKEGSFFHTRYGDKFNLIGEVELFPPTLIMTVK
jgi:hypothetical protein